MKVFLPENNGAFACDLTYFYVKREPTSLCRSSDGRHLTQIYVKRHSLSKNLQPSVFENNTYQPIQYFSHPDHLGSTSFITSTFGYDQRNNYSSRYTFSAKEKDNETGYSYFGARYYDSDLSVWLSVDPMAKERSWVSPYSYCQNNPIIRTDPIGALDWKPPTDGSGIWTAEVGDSPGSLAIAAHITQAEAESAVRTANQNRKQPRSSDIMVYPGDKVYVPNRPGHTGNSTTSSSASIISNTASTNSNTSGSFDNLVQTVSNVNNAAGIVIPAAQQTIQNTKAGANFAYAISGNIKVMNAVNNIFKYAPYVGLGTTILTGIYLSKTIDPATNRPYQSWVETGTDIGANIGTIYLGAQYGGWVGAGAAAFYVADKAAFKWYINTVREHPEYVLPPSVHCFTH